VTRHKSTQPPRAGCTPLPATERLLLGFRTPSPYPWDVALPCRAWASPAKACTVFTRSTRAGSWMNRRIIGWKRPLRPSSPTITPTPPRLLNHVPKGHIHTFSEPLQGWGLPHCPGQPGPVPEEPGWDHGCGSWWSTTPRPLRGRHGHRSETNKQRETQGSDVKTFVEHLDWEKKLEYSHKYSWIAGLSLFSIEKYPQLTHKAQCTLLMCVYSFQAPHCTYRDRHTHHTWTILCTQCFKLPVQVPCPAPSSAGRLWKEPHTGLAHPGDTFTI